MNKNAIQKAIIRYGIMYDSHAGDRDEGFMTQQQYEKAIEFELERAMDVVGKDHLAAIDAAVLEARIDELKRLPWNHQNHAFSWHDIQDRIAELQRGKDKKAEEPKQ
jgi:hypothetical protein